MRLSHREKREQTSQKRKPMPHGWFRLEKISKVTNSTHGVTGKLNADEQNSVALQNHTVNKEDRIVSEMNTSCDSRDRHAVSTWANGEDISGSGNRLLRFDTEPTDDTDTETTTTSRTY